MKNLFFFCFTFLLLVSSSHAVMKRTVVNQFAYESLAACVFTTGESNGVVPLSEQLNFIKSMRYKQTSEGDMLPREFETALNTNFADTVQVVTDLKREGRVDCLKVMQEVSGYYISKLHADDMHVTQNADKHFVSALEAIRKVDHLLASQYR
ncbi:hypothetical protein ACG99R_004706 [Klebsiella aerogenes]